MIHANHPVDITIDQFRGLEHPFQLLDNRIKEPGSATPDQIQREYEALNDQFEGGDQCVQVSVKGSQVVRAGQDSLEGAAVRQGGHIDVVGLLKQNLDHELCGSRPNVFVVVRYSKDPDRGAIRRQVEVFSGNGFWGKALPHLKPMGDQHVAWFPRMSWNNRLQAYSAVVNPETRRMLFEGHRSFGAAEPFSVEQA